MRTSYETKYGLWCSMTCIRYNPCTYPSDRPRDLPLPLSPGALFKRIPLYLSKRSSWSPTDAPIPLYLPCTYPLVPIQAFVLEPDRRPYPLVPIFYISPCTYPSFRLGARPTPLSPCTCLLPTSYYAYNHPPRMLTASLTI